jgi:protein gp37
MELNESKGNMYDFVTHTWNPVKGKCEHDCLYCYMKEFGKQNEIHLDNTEFKTDLGTNNFIFVGSGTDLFAENIPKEWILETLNYCHNSNNDLFNACTNKYLFQSKNPKRILEFINHPVFEKSVLCTTVVSTIKCCN